MMKANNPRFVTSAYNYEDFPRHRLPEFAFSGRSNVGKSSLINKLINRKKLAKTSSTPGKTQSINFYNIDNRLYLVDLPGYGFAKVPEKLKDEWAELIDSYLHERRNLAGIIQIIDVRHKPTEDDQLMVEWLKEVSLPTIIVATKVDKLSNNQRYQKEKIIKETLDLSDDIELVYFSAKTGTGKNHISNFIQEVSKKYRSNQ